MDEKELSIVRDELRKAYQSWHVCALQQTEARRLKVPLGTLCDVCEQCVQSHMANIRKKLRLELPVIPEDEFNGTRDEVQARGVMPKIDGKFFRCECGCNVFTKSKTRAHILRCNSCLSIYSSEHNALVV